jgi:RNA polymerase sigma-70 factor, ECF subfamily
LTNSQVNHLSPFSLQKFLNKSSAQAVFMVEGKRVVAGEAILNEIAATEAARTESKGAALEALVREHSRLVYRIAYAVLRCHHDAEDAAQETFLRVLRYDTKLEQIENPKPWLARIAWRVAVDRNKHRRHGEISFDDPERTDAEPASTAATADETTAGAQLGALLEKLIAALPEKLREPLILSTLEEMTPREVAATLNLNEAAVRSRVFRARQILKQKLSSGMSRN